MKILDQNYILEGFVETFKIRNITFLKKILITICYKSHIYKPNLKI